MSDDQLDYEAACAGKDRFPSASAIDAAIRLFSSGKLNSRQRGNGGWDQSSAYECKFCGHFHFGHPKLP